MGTFPPPLKLRGVLTTVGKGEAKWDEWFLAANNADICEVQNAVKFARQSIYGLALTRVLLRFYCVLSYSV